MIADEFPTVRVAAVHAASAYLDLDACIEKACSLITHSANQGARLIVFPEAFIPGYPFWIWTHAPLDGRALYQRLFANSLKLDSPHLARLGACARKAGAVVVIGITEREGTSLYNTLLFFGTDGELMGRHRKLQMTNVERIVWAQGDGSGLRVYQTQHGRIGGLICGEHSLDLVRHALTAQHEQIHIAAWPGLSAVTHNPRAAVFSDLSEVAARYHAFAGQCFVVSVHSRIDQDTIDKLGFTGRPDMVTTGGGRTVIVGPDGCLLAGPHIDAEDILFADIDLSRIIHAKQIYDSAGHYARPDVVQLLLNREAAPSIMMARGADTASQDSIAHASPECAALSSDHD